MYMYISSGPALPAGAEITNRNIQNYGQDLMNPAGGTSISIRISISMGLRFPPGPPFINILLMIIIT